MTTRFTRTWFLRTLLGASLAAAAYGQADPPANRRFLVFLVTLKPEMVQEWENLVKTEVIPAYKKAGVKSVQTMQTVLGPGSEYSIVTETGVSALDGKNPLERALGAEGAAKLVAKLQRCSLVSRRFLSTMQTELSNPPAEGKTSPIAVLVRSRLTPGKAQEYRAYLRSEVLPHYKKANLPISVYQRGLGAGSNEWVNVTFANSFEEIESGPALRRILGVEAYQKLQQKATPLRTPVDTTVRRLRPDLSY